MTPLGETIMKRILIFLASSIIVASLIVSTVSAEYISSGSHEIEISTTEEKITVKETIILQGSSDEHIGIISFWIQDGAEEVSIVVKGSSVSHTTSDNEYITNLSSLEIEMDSEPKIEITYKLDKNTENFQKELLRNTSYIKVTFNDNVLYTCNNIASGMSFTLSLYQPTETTLSTYIIVAVVLIIVLLAVVSFYFMRRQKTSKIKKIAIESEELLATKKALLMNLLKDIEKQHRAKEISDDTYNKLKEQYKQEAVEAMKELEDMKSKVK